jgi:hypothetical protein
MVEETLQECKAHSWSFSLPKLCITETLASSKTRKMSDWLSLGNYRQQM